MPDRSKDGVQTKVTLPALPVGGCARGQRSHLVNKSYGNTKLHFSCSAVVEQVTPRMTSDSANIWEAIVAVPSAVDTNTKIKNNYI